MRQVLLNWIFFFPLEETRIEDDSIVIFKCLRGIYDRDAAEFLAVGKLRCIVVTISLRPS